MRRFAALALRIAVTLLVVGGAVGGGVVLWNWYMIKPWTRDGRVRAYVVGSAPDVGGLVVKVPVRDNQVVHRGDVLFVIDPSYYHVALEQSEANLERAQVTFRTANENALRRERAAPGAVAATERITYQGQAAEAQAAVDVAKADLDRAKLNMERTIVRSTVNGFVTNLNLRVGDYVSTGRMVMSVLDSDSFWVTGYFEETKLPGIHPGSPASIELMGVPAQITGHVQSIGRGIADQNDASNSLGLPEVNPVFVWVRLAQRIPVRIAIDHVPSGVVLVAGQTATIVIHPANWRPPSQSEGGPTIASARQP